MSDTEIFWFSQQNELSHHYLGYWDSGIFQYSQVYTTKEYVYKTLHYERDGYRITTIFYTFYFETTLGGPHNAV